MSPVKKILLSSVLIFLSEREALFSPAHATSIPEGPSFQWELQITNPNFELKYYKLTEKAHKSFLPKTSWRCQVSPTKVKGTLHLKELTCNYSIKKTGIVTTLASCSSHRPYAEAFLKLYDEKKGLEFQIMLKCRSLAGAL